MKIEFLEAGVTYEGRAALHPLTLTLTGRRIGIIGLNGSGKTTFARLINGLTKPTTGKVRVNGRDTVDDQAAVTADAGYVFQSPQNQIILPILKDDIELGLKARGVAKADLAQRAEESLARLGIAHLAERRAHELSGGELQLAALAAVLATRPSLVILDEPTNQLDLKNRRRVAETIDALNEDVIAISHDLATLSTFERVLLFHEGRLVSDGPAASVIAEYEAMNR
ncbi:energy-coupling factor ABC transporter ATP-binding protein [Martelella lutilitoris]|uniref:Energy-coupling factor ABC transporter ATP-binding protein n=1 Tax=Martelella lutilitoris TaxID=2583532 RepID=A0A5C4JR63_9HYPH|nr:energy-coupling factor ABC transporter ATP-binding protein [Martelella lutilitoris]TNB47843.1 energy-coupling factor ABC transporter ATP-binding protein [Martelella lutilitoris]